MAIARKTMRRGFRREAARRYDTSFGNNRLYSQGRCVFRGNKYSLFDSLFQESVFQRASRKSQVACRRRYRKIQKG